LLTNSLNPPSNTSV